jgi:hypothetical protein
MKNCNNVAKTRLSHWLQQRYKNKNEREKKQ